MPLASVTIACMNLDASDAELVDQTMKGITAAFQVLANRYYRPVGGFVFKRVGRADLVEDLVQETFLEAFASLKAGRGPTNFSSWIFGIAHNRCGKWLRRKRPVLFDPNETPEAATTPSDQLLLEEVEEQQKLISLLDHQLQSLPDETRQLLELKHQSGKTCEEIAEQIGRPVGTVKSLLARTYKALRVALSSREKEAKS